MWPGRTRTFFLVLVLLMSYGIAYAMGVVREDRVLAEVGESNEVSQKRSFNE